MVENYALISELMKHEFPMDDYRKFSIGWPYTPDVIKQQHEFLSIIGFTKKQLDQHEHWIHEYKSDMAS